MVDRSSSFVLSHQCWSTVDSGTLFQSSANGNVKLGWSVQVVGLDMKDGKFTATGVTIYEGGNSNDETLQALRLLIAMMSLPWNSGHVSSRFGSLRIADPEIHRPMLSKVMVPLPVRSLPLLIERAS